MYMDDRALSSADRGYFDRVSIAAYANPFSAERDRIDRELAGAESRPGDVLPEATQRIRRALERAGKDGRPDIRGYRPEDRELLEHVLLFDVFHRHAADFDDAIERERASAGPVRMEFAGFPITPNNELNSFTWNACGRSTRGDYLESFRGADDGFEYFGCAMKTTHLLAVDGTDDGYDSQLGTRNTAQYVIVRTDTHFAPGGAASGFGERATR